MKRNGNGTVACYGWSDSDGGYPQGRLVSDNQGNLFGVTAWGVNACHCGTIFKFTPCANADATKLP
jgi:uncharacterized repeat protein (TIGR03803 family)